MTITVDKLTEETFKVTVTVEDAKTTAHTVTVTPEYYQKLTGGSVPPETLVERSFEFLLEWESNTSIPRTFDLEQIQSYFPAYERTMRNLFAQA